MNTIQFQMRYAGLSGNNVELNQMVKPEEAKETPTHTEVYDIAEVDIDTNQPEA